MIRRAEPPHVEPPHVEPPPPSTARRAGRLARDAQRWWNTVGWRRTAKVVKVSLLASLSLDAQAAPEPHLGAARAMRFEHLSIEDGLSQSVVNTILQDSTGFLWVGTQNGLNRFDGYGFTVYRHEARDPTSLASDWVLVLREAPSGDLWVGTEGGGLSRWRRATNSFVNYRHDPADSTSLSGDWVVALTWDHAGMLWVGTRDSGLNRFDPQTGKFERFRHDPADPSSLASDQVTVLHVDPVGNLWVGSRGGLDLFEARSQTFGHFDHDPADPESLSDNRVRALLEDRSGTLWVGTHGGLNRFDASRQNFQRFLHDPADRSSLSHDWVRCLLEDSQGRLWVGTDGGLNLWQGEGRGFVSYRANPSDPLGLASDQIVTLYQDRGGLLWVGTVGSGLARWNPVTWSFPLYRSDDDDAASNMVFSISEDTAGGLWIGTLGGGLERRDRATGKSVRYNHDPEDPSSLGDNRVTALLHDSQGILWIGTVDGGLGRLDPSDTDRARFQHYRHDPARDDSIASNAVTHLLEDRRGKLWVGTLGGGLNLHRGDGEFVRYRHAPADDTSLSSDRVFALAEDNGGFLWLATDGGGLSRLHPATGAFLRFDHDPQVPPSLASNELLTVHTDAAGRLWIGTKGAGLDLLRRPEDTLGEDAFEHFGHAQGLPDNTVWGLRSDQADRLWIATNNGLARLDPETGAVKTYSVSHGLQSNEFNMGAHYVSTSGELFFGGVGGLNAFFPEHVEAEPRSPPVVFTAFSRIDRPATLGPPLFDVEEISLGHEDYLVSFEAAVLDFAAPGKNQYRYQLEGLDADWVDLGERRRMTFTNLDPGRYTLRVRGANHDGVWSEDEAQLRLVVAPPPWRSAWAYALYILAVAAAVGGFVRQQQRKVELERAATRRERALAEERRLLLEELAAKNSELERFNYTVSHDLKSPLVTIKGFLGMLENDIAAGDSERQLHDVRRIGAAADRMRKLLDEMLELSTLGHQELQRELIPAAEVAAEALEVVAGEIADGGVEIAVDPQLPTVSGDRLRLRQVYQNLLANAVKYMGNQPQPRVQIGYRHAAEGEPVLFVRDNGSGIDHRYHDKIFGLFERLDATDKGTGVGLALAQRIVEMHGGRIWVESEGEGQGSTFCFT
ncbi:MAG: two-component regulator propeller domain-containing protein, partial [Acidobacteriota bacterium]